GFFQPLVELSFRILRPDGTELLTDSIDPTDTAYHYDPVDGIPVGDGRIVALPFTVAEDEPTGLYTIQVTFVAHPTNGAELAEQTVEWQFRVLDEAQGYLATAYAQLQDMLDEGFPIGATAPAGGYTYAQARSALLRASRYVEQITRRIFRPQYLVVDCDGRGSSILQFEQEIIGLAKVAFTYTTFSPADLPIEEGDLRVYNRHIRQRLFQPDDREDPRVEFLRVPSATYPRSTLFASDLLSGSVGFVASQQSVKFRGMWGYTDPDGSPFGCTPHLIREATLRIAARYIGPLWAQVGGGSSGVAGPLLSERTMDQSVTYAYLATQMRAGAYAG